MRNHFTPNSSTCHHAAFAGFGLCLQNGECCGKRRPHSLQNLFMEHRKKGASLPRRPRPIQPAVNEKPGDTKNVAGQGNEKRVARVVLWVILGRRKEIYIAGMPRVNTNQKGISGSAGIGSGAGGGSPSAATNSA